MRKEKLLQDLSLRLLSEQSLEQNINVLYSFLSQHIPFTQILFYSVDVQSCTITPWVILEDGVIVGKYENQFLKNMSAEEILRVNSEYKNGVYMENDTIANHFYNQNANLFLTDRKSLIGMNMGEGENSFFGINLQSTIQNQFTQEHCDILLMLKDVLEQLIFTFFSNTPQSTLAINNTKAKSKSSFELLKDCKGLAHILKEIEAVAKTDTTVLICGDTGVGKELVADSIHHLSSRKSSAFIKVNCSAISENLIESELFGHERGAFTSATHLHQGFFEQADNGTLYLDEVGELSLSAQAKLLRVLESKEIRRIGGMRTVPINVRLVAATHQNLDEKVANKTFREDLYYRLMVFPVRIPALRKRREDIKYLAEHFYTEFVELFKIVNPPPMSQELINKMYKMQWLGNVRQLKHSIERALILCSGKNTLSIEEYSPNQKLIIDDENEIFDINYQTKKYIEQALIKSKGRIDGEFGAAKLLGIKANTLRSRMKKLDIAVKREIL